MRFTSAELVENTLWTMRQADLPRGEQRAKIAKLANGDPPYSKRERDANPNLKTNVNFLEMPKLLAEGRRSYHNAFMKPGQFAKATLDSSANDAPAWSRRVTYAWNRIMKRSISYLEFLKSQFAMDVMHGIGPAFWDNPDSWCPVAVGIEDAMIPSNTRLDMTNLSHFGIFRQWTFMELYQMTHRAKVDPGWNMPVVNAALKWVEEQIQSQPSYSETYAPEKVEERWHQNLGYYGTDAVPTIDAWDFYFWSDDGKRSGWRRRMVLDTPTSDEVGGTKAVFPRKNRIGMDHGQWLYNPGDNRVYADKREHILQFDFADLSASAPFRYHSVRSLGWLLYAVSHLSNRLRCKVNDALFESLLQYFRTSNPDDRERMLKIDLHDLGIIPEGVTMVPRNDRWQVDQGLVKLGLEENQAMMNSAAAQYREGRESMSQKTEKTATQVMSEVNAANAMVGAVMLLEYEYKKFQCDEIFRRFCRKNSTDPDVRKFRNNVLKHGVPEEMLDPERWDIQPERVLGSGNKMLEIAMADKLMAIRPQLDPESQREVDQMYISANSDLPDVAQRLVPMEGKRVSDSVHEAQLMIGTLMQGVKVEPKKGQNPIEMIETLLKGLKTIMTKLQVKGAAITQDDLVGAGNVVAHIGVYLNTLAQDKTQKERVKLYGQILKEFNGTLKKMGDALQQQGQQGGNGGLDPKDAAKINATVLMGQTKAKLAAESHAQRTQQREVQFRMKTQQDAEKHQLEQAKKLHETKVDTQGKDIIAAATIRRGRLKAIEGD